MIIVFYTTVFRGHRLEQTSKEIGFTTTVEHHERVRIMQLGQEICGTGEWDIYHKKL